MQLDQLKRRAFIMLLGVATVWPLAARGHSSLLEGVRKRGRPGKVALFLFMDGWGTHEPSGLPEQAPPVYDYDYGDVRRYGAGRHQILQPPQGRTKVLPEDTSSNVAEQLRADSEVNKADDDGNLSGKSIGTIRTREPDLGLEGAGRSSVTRSSADDGGSTAVRPSSGEGDSKEKDDAPSSSTPKDLETAVGGNNEE
jgi:hypothetical protein